jgi:subtilase family serine protease
VVQGVTVSPPDSAIGATVVITATIKNQGSSKTQTSLVTLYIDGILAASQELPPIDAGQSRDASFNWITEANTHTFKITADINNTVIESDETNNDKQIQFSTMTPDLVVQNCSWNTANQLNSNEVNFTITVKNIGTGAAGAYKLKYSFDDTSAVIKDMLPLPAGQTAELSFTSILSTGAHTAYITVDSNNAVAELKEDNNASVFNFSTIAPDLVVRTVTWTPLDAKIGDKMTITARVENQGAAKATKPRVALLIDGASAGYVDVPEIDINSVATVDFSWTATAGQHEISVLANSNNTVLESNISNNSKSRTISFEKPTVPVKKSDSLPAVTATDKGFLNSWWWLLLLIAGVLGVAAFVTALRAAKKKY